MKINNREEGYKVVEYYKERIGNSLVNTKKRLTLLDR